MNINNLVKCVFSCRLSIGKDKFIPLFQYGSVHRSYLRKDKTRGLREYIRYCYHSSEISVNRRRSNMLRGEGVKTRSRFYVELRNDNGASNNPQRPASLSLQQF